MQRKIILAIFILNLQNNNCLAQVIKPNDTSQVKYLQDITVVGRNSKSDYQQMPEIIGTNK
ncbi:MAG: hypothetical protein ABL929_00995 [Ferruginibacter sp.]|nr:hypothetical protein [Ferruginibacter sp.]